MRWPTHRGWVSYSCRAALAAVPLTAAVLAASLLAATVAAGARGVKAHVSPQDRAATHAYLAAEYAYDSAVTQDAAASSAAVEALGNRLAQQCPGVVRSAPRERMPSSTQTPPTPRQRGEENRVGKQRGELAQELHQALEIAALESHRQAALTSAARLKPLRWTDPAITLLVHSAGAFLEWDATRTAPNVCADMGAWAASGYKTLSAATKALHDEEEGLLGPVLRRLRTLAGAVTAHNDLSSYEGPRERALATKIKALRRQRQQLQRTLYNMDDSVERALGLSDEEERKPPLAEGPPKGSVTIGHGRTAAGSRYTIRLLPKQAASGSGDTPCRVTMEIETTVQGRGPTGGRFVGGGSSSTCLSTSHPEPPSVECDGGLVTVEAQTRRRTRMVRLRLSNGRQLTSRVALVPPRLGGPTGWYYQAVRGPSPIPVSFTELDAHGKTLRTVKLHRVLECSANPIHYFPGGIRTLVHGRTPGGPAFSIIGKHYRFQGRAHFELSIEVEQELEDESPGSGGSVVFFGGAERQQRGSKLLDWQIETGCHPHEYAILYGLLKAPQDTVLTRMPGSLQPFRRMRIPAALHAGGALVYAALPAVPSELLIRTPGGKIVAKEKLDPLPRETSEQCQGEAEPTG